MAFDCSARIRGADGDQARRTRLDECSPAFKPLCQLPLQHGLRNPGSGGKARHNEIATNSTTAIKIAVRGLETLYRVYNSAQKIYIPSEKAAVYPDALMICKEPEFWNGREDLVTNPLAVVEVLSKSTKKHDKGPKFMLYRNIESFKEYVLVEQDFVNIEVWFQNTNDTWQRKIYTDINDSFELKSIGVTILLADIYENIEFQ